MTIQSSNSKGDTMYQSINLIEAVFSVDDYRSIRLDRTSAQCQHTESARRSIRTLKFSEFKCLAVIVDQIDRSNDNSIYVSYRDRSFDRYLCISKSEYYRETDRMRRKLFPQYFTEIDITRSQ